MGILESGFGTTVHLPVNTENSSFIAPSIYGRYITKTQEIAKCHSMQSFNNWEELIADPDVELIVIATPNHQHFEMAKFAIKHKKHVLIEITISDFI